MLCYHWCRQAAWRHSAGVERTIGVPVKLLCRDVGLHLAVKLLGGRVHIMSVGVSTSYLVALSRQSLRAVTARDLGSISYTVAELLGGCLLCDVDVSAGVFTLVDFYFHFAGLQPAFEEAQQQAAAAGGHYASEAQATPRVDVGDSP